MSGALTSCFEEQKVETPAQEQIDEYTKQAEECKESEVEKGEEQKSSLITTKDQPRGFYVMKDDMVLGDPESKIVLVEYFSPTCPHCALYHKMTFPEISKKYIETKKIAYVIRDFVGNKQDLDAAILARCNGSLDSYLKFVSVILQQQSNWATTNKYREILTNIGSLGGVSAENYANCLNDQEKAKILVENTALASKSRGFVGTPAFFFNGTQFFRPYTAEELSKEIDRLLQESSK